jgi:hypothetical protein
MNQDVLPEWAGRAHFAPEHEIQLDALRVHAITLSVFAVRRRIGPSAANWGKGHLMTRLRSALVTAAAVALLAVPAAMGTASAAPVEAAPVQAMEPGCAKLGGYGPGWADIHNVWGHTISASVEVDGWDPSCIQIGPGGVGRIGLEAGDEPYYAYEC